MFDLEKVSQMLTDRNNNNKDDNNEKDTNNNNNRLRIMTIIRIIEVICALPFF